MNTYLLGLLSKWVTILYVSVTGIFNQATEEKIEINNSNIIKNLNVQAQTIKYKTTTIYNNNLPIGTTITKEEGQNGLMYTNKNHQKIIQESKNEVIEVGTKEKETYVGKLTGYGADCQGCQGTGNLSCKTKDGKTWSLIKDGPFYNDQTYGKIRILAAALEKFPCGTIIEVQSPSLGTFTSIVLDTGGAMKTAWEQGIVHMDLAFVTEKNTKVYEATGNNIKFNIKRWGW